MASYKHMLTGLIMTPSDPDVERQFEESGMHIKVEEKRERAQAEKPAAKRAPARKSKSE